MPKFTEEQLLIQETARRFAQERLLPGAEERDETEAFATEELKEMGQLGLMGMTVDPGFGGSGLDMTSWVLAVEEIAAADGGVSTILCIQGLIEQILAQYGNEDQQNTYLPKLASGEMIGAFALTEPHAGSDAAAIQTRAVKDGDHYVLNGSKQFITSGKHGHVAVVFALTDPEAGKKGMSAFLVPTDTPGYEVAGIEKKMGQKTSDTAQLNFNDMRVPAVNMLGAEGEGYKIALANLEGGRISIAAQCLGMARAAYEASVTYAKERESFNQPLIHHQAVGHTLADMATQLEAARLMVLQAAELRQNNYPCLKEACMAKLMASEAGEKICNQAIQVHGGYGYVKDFPVERIYRDMRVCTIYEGTSDIQRMIISREIARENG